MMEVVLFPSRCQTFVVVPLTGIALSDYSAAIEPELTRSRSHERSYTVDLDQ